MLYHYTSSQIELITSWYIFLYNFEFFVRFFSMNFYIMRVYEFLLKLNFSILKFLMWLICFFFRIAVLVSHYYLPWSHY